MIHLAVLRQDMRLTAFGSSVKTPELDGEGSARSDELHVEDSNLPITTIIKHTNLRRFGDPNPKVANW